MKSTKFAHLAKPAPDQPGRLDEQLDLIWAWLRIDPLARLVDREEAWQVCREKVLEHARGVVI